MSDLFYARETELVAEALFKQQYPFYTWATQDKNTKYRFIDMADKLIEALKEHGLFITEKDNRDE